MPQSPLPPSSPNDRSNTTAVSSPARSQDQNPKSQPNPFPGLRPFEESDASLFFGRTSQITELLRHLKNHRFLAVIGVSGSGKSSLIRAGLIPRLRQGFLTGAGDQWKSVVLRPGKTPIQALVGVLKKSFGDESSVEDFLESGSHGLLDLMEQSLGPNENLLIVVDQFEEIFRFKHLSENEGPEGRIHAVEQAADFVALLLRALGDERFHVVLTMRSDFLGDCAQFQELAEHMNKGQYLIPRLTLKEQREIIVRPVWAQRAQISELLVQRLKDDVGPEPEQLPVLQHVLMRLWQDWASNPDSDAPIDIENYKKIGKFEQAMDWHGEKVYKGLPSDLHRWVCKRLFQRITLKGTADRPVRRAETLEDIRSIIDDVGPDADNILWEVLKTFLSPEAAFLTSPEVEKLNQFLDSPTTRKSNPKWVIDISHESLCRLWKRLDGWVAKEGESAEWYTRLSNSASLHRNQREGLYKEPGLTYVFSTYKPGENSSCNPEEEADPWSKPWSVVYNTSWHQTLEYLQKSKEVHDKEKAKEELERERRERDQRKRDRRMVLFGAAGIVGASLLITLGILFAFLRDRANFELANEYASLSSDQRHRLGESTQERAALLAIKSIQIHETESNLDIANWESFERITLATQAQGLSQVTGKLTGKLFVVNDGASQKSSGFHVILTPEPKPQDQSGLELPSFVAMKLDDQSAALKQDKTFLQFISGGFTAISYSGKYASGHCRNRNATIYDTHHKIPFDIPCNSDIVSIFESRGSPRVAVVQSIGIAQVFEISSQRPWKILYKTKSGCSLQRINLSSDGKYITAVCAKNGNISIETRDLDQPRAPQSEPQMLSSKANAFSFSPDGRLLAIGTNTGQIELYDLPRMRKSLLELPSHNAAITVLAFSNDSKMLASAGEDTIVRVVQFQKQGAPLILWSDHFGRPVSDITFSHSDQLIGLAVGESTARIKYTRTGFETVRVVHKHPSRVTSIAFSPDEKTAFSVSDRGEVLSFPSKNSQPSESASLDCRQPQSVVVSSSYNGKTVIAACPHSDGAMITPVAELFKVDKFAVDSSANIAPLKHIKELGRGTPFQNSDNGQPFCHVAISGDGHLGAAECNDKIQMFDLRKNLPFSGPPVRQFGKSCHGESLALNYDGSLLAVGNSCNSILVYEIGNEPWPLKAFITSPGNLDPSNTQPHKITAIAFSGASTMIAAGTDRGTIWVTQMKDQKSLFKQEDLQGAIGAIEFGPGNKSGDSSALIFGSGGTAAVISIGDHQKLAQISVPNSYITAVAFAPNGIDAAAGDSNGVVHVFDLSSSSLTQEINKRVLSFFGYKTLSANAAQKTWNGKQKIYSLRFLEGRKLLVGTQQYWLLEPEDLDNDASFPLALTSHDLCIHKRLQRICKNLSNDLDVRDINQDSLKPTRVCTDQLLEASVAKETGCPH